MNQWFGLVLGGSMVVCGCTNQANNGAGQQGAAGTSVSPIIGGGVAGMGSSMTTTGTSGTGVQSGMMGAAGSKPSGTAGTMSGGSAGMMASTAGKSGGTAGTGASGAAGTSSAAGAGGAAGSTTTGPQMPCLTKGSDVLLIGDSYIDTPVYLTPHLESAATADMQLPAGQHYNVQAVAGTQSPQIANQWQLNKNPAPEFVVMDGGGNDVLIGANTCITASDTDAYCDSVADMANVNIMAIWTDMKASGVKAVVYFYYAHIPLTGPSQECLTTEMNCHYIVDYGKAKQMANCAAISDDKFKCVFVDTMAALDPHPEYYGDGIHPSLTPGPDTLAGVIWKGMKDNCIAQTSGCCSAN